ncbi:transferrin receptor protein 2 isoform X3 [Zonotrichia albicollis]|uniref:transferrin receptor protein 2 isoform X3 n=1 Tax=Zonotrichia albicollis TaxID=44394 RepID=UPI003D81255C
METLRRCFHGRPPGGGPVSYSRHRNPRGEEEEEEEEGAESMVRLPRPRTRPRRRPRPWLHPLATLALGSATAFLLGLLVAALGHTPCRTVGAGPLPGGSTPDLVWGGASAEAPPPRPRLRELLRQHLREERVEQWAREVSSGPHGAGSGRGRALAQSVLSALAGAGLSRAWSRPQPLPLPVRAGWSMGTTGAPRTWRSCGRGGWSCGDTWCCCGWGGAAPPNRCRPCLPRALWAFSFTATPGTRPGWGGAPRWGGEPRPPCTSLGPPLAPPRWGVPGGSLRFRPRPGGRRLQLRVGAGTRPGTLTSVFGALRGRLEPDCYIIVGAQRDSLGPGAAASGVGTALLLELARFFAAIGREGFQLRRTLLFVSWDGAEFGHLGATEWLEGYPGLLHTKVAAYVSLDRPVLGADRFVVRTSPTLGPLIESALEQVESPNEGGKSLLEQLRRPGRGWESDVIRPLAPESGAFPFTAAAGVPALELGFDEAPGGGGGTRAALGTPEDTLSRLGARLRGRLPAVSRAVAAVAAQLLLRLGHDPRLPLEPAAIGDALVRQLAPLQARGLSLQCLSSARGGVVRAAAALRRDMSGSDGANERLNRGFNARLMAAEASLLSPFVSPLVSPFRHVLLGRGGHTLAALVAELGTQRGTPGDNEGTPGDNVGTPGDNVGTAGDKLGTRGNSTRTHRDSEGTLGNSQGTPGDNEGTPGDNVGTPGDHEGTPRDNEGTPGDHEGTSGDHEGTLGDSVQLRLALLAWTLRGTAGALAGDSGDIGDIGDIGGGLGDSGDCGDMGGGFGDIGGHGDIGDIKSGFGDIGGGRGDSWDSEDTWGYGDSWEQGGPGDRNGDFGDTQGDFGDRNGDFGDLGDTQGRVGPW